MTVAVNPTGLVGAADEAPGVPRLVNAAMIVSLGSAPLVQENCAEYVPTDEVVAQAQTPRCPS